MSSENIDEIVEQFNDIGKLFDVQISIIKGVSHLLTVENSGDVNTSVADALNENYYQVKEKVKRVENLITELTRNNNSQ